MLSVFDTIDEAAKCGLYCFLQAAVEAQGQYGQITVPIV
ncbi:hypothetical protein CAter282_3501 [Collimonas arenae]|uniref:Uncharacterized protein n=1 Tax=Collimonas arenae TaxID=279058 RepID=A0A127PTY6_9BURK|nr:hypothetical protein CAter10_3835 [Collimonas arenae]AMP11189.1 hypothetical protein CAter282_3501 [Collimonas arenae]